MKYCESMLLKEKKSFKRACLKDFFIRFLWHFFHFFLSTSARYNGSCKILFALMDWVSKRRTHSSWYHMREKSLQRWLKPIVTL